MWNPVHAGIESMCLLRADVSSASLPLHHSDRLIQYRTQVVLAHLLTEGWRTGGSHIVFEQKNSKSRDSTSEYRVPTRPRTYKKANHSSAITKRVICIRKRFSHPYTFRNSIVSLDVCSRETHTDFKTFPFVGFTHSCVKGRSCPPLSLSCFSSSLFSKKHGSCRNSLFQHVPFDAFMTDSADAWLHGRSFHFRWNPSIETKLAFDHRNHTPKLKQNEVP